MKLMIRYTLSLLVQNPDPLVQSHPRGSVVEVLRTWSSVEHNGDDSSPTSTGHKNCLFYLLETPHVNLECQALNGFDGSVCGVQR